MERSGKRPWCSRYVQACCLWRTGVPPGELRRVSARGVRGVIKRVACGARAYRPGSSGEWPVEPSSERPWRAWCVQACCLWGACVTPGVLRRIACGALGRAPRAFAGCSGVLPVVCGRSAWGAQASRPWNIRASARGVRDVFRRVLLNVDCSGSRDSVTIALGTKCSESRWPGGIAMNRTQLHG